MHIDIKVAWVTLRLSTIQKVIYYHNSPNILPHAHVSFETQTWTVLPKMSIWTWNKQQTLLEALGESESLAGGKMCSMFPSTALPFISVPLGSGGTGEFWHYLSRGTSSDRCKDILQRGKQFVCSYIYWLQPSGWRWWLLFHWTSFHEKAVDWLRVTQSYSLEIRGEAEPKLSKMWASGAQAELWTWCLLGRQLFGWVLPASHQIPVRAKAKSWSNFARQVQREIWTW